MNWQWAGNKPLSQSIMTKLTDISICHKAHKNWRCRIEFIISKLEYHQFRQWFITFSMPSYDLNNELLLTWCKLDHLEYVLVKFEAKIYKYAHTKMHFKMSSAQPQPFCSGFAVLIDCFPTKHTTVTLSNLRTDTCLILSVVKYLC